MTHSRRFLPEALAPTSAALLACTVPTTAELLANGYERWFGLIHDYVSRHVAGRVVRERIVREVLSENLDLLVGRRLEALEISRLTRSTDRLIADAVEDAELFLRSRRAQTFQHARRKDALGEIR